MLIWQRLICIVLLLFLIPCCSPQERSPNKLGESPENSINKAHKFGSQGGFQGNEKSLQSLKPSEGVKDKPKEAIQIEVRDNRSNKENMGIIEWFQLIVVTAQFILIVSCIFGIYSISSSALKTINETRNELGNATKNIDKKIEKVDQGVSEKVDQFLLEKYPDINRKINSKIERYLEGDFSKSLEQRYLYMEYVYLSLWEELAEAINAAIIENDIKKAFSLWNKLYVARLALRQMVSGDDVEVGNGIAELWGAAKDGWVHPDHLWDFICLLRKQDRLSSDNQDLASELGREIGKTFRECNGTDDDF